MRYGYGEAIVTTAADISRNFGRWQDRAISGPVVVTHHGRPRVVIVSADHFARWTNGAPSPNKGGEFTFETSLAAVVDNLRDGFLALDRQLSITAVNAVAEAHLQLPRSQLIGFKLTERFPDLNSTVPMERIMRVLKTGVSDTFEGSSVVVPDRYISMRIFPYPEGVALLFSNISEDLIQKDQLQAAHAVATTLNESTRTTFIRLNNRGFIIDQGPLFCEMSGLASRDLFNIRLSELLTSSDRPIFNQAIEGVFQQGVSRRLECHVVTKTRGNLPVEFSMAPLATGYAKDGAYILASLTS